MKVYISGKITGDDNYREKFKKAEEKLKSMGHIVMNPAILPEGFTHSEYMDICIPMISVCDAIYMLSDWNESKGAEEEYETAKCLEKTIMFEGESNVIETDINILDKKCVGCKYWKSILEGKLVGECCLNNKIEFVSYCDTCSQWSYEEE